MPYCAFGVCLEDINVTFKNFQPVSVLYLLFFLEGNLSLVQYRLPPSINSIVSLTCRLVVYNQPNFQQHTNTNHYTSAYHVQYFILLQHLSVVRYIYFIVYFGGVCSV